MRKKKGASLVFTVLVVAIVSLVVAGVLIYLSYKGMGLSGSLFEAGNKSSEMLNEAVQNLTS